MLSYGENSKFLSYLGLQQYRDVTDTKMARHQDRQNHCS